MTGSSLSWQPFSQLLVAPELPVPSPSSTPLPVRTCARGPSLIRCADRLSSLPPLSLELVQAGAVAAVGSPPAVVVLNLSDIIPLLAHPSRRMSRFPLP
jgi:hypothetical protein